MQRTPNKKRLGQLHITDLALKPFRSLRILTKLLLGLAVITLLIFTIGGLGYLRSVETEKIWDEVSNQTIPEIRLLEEIKVSGLANLNSVHELLVITQLVVPEQTLESHVHVQGMVMDRISTPAEELVLHEEISEFNDAKSNLEKKLALYEALIDTGGKASEYYNAYIEKTALNLLSATDQMSIFALNKDNALNILELKESLEEAEKTFLKVIDQALEEVREEIEGQTADISQSIFLSQLIIALFSFIALIIIILFGLIIYSSIATPLKALVEAALKIADGDFDYKVKIDFNDELGELAHAFGRMSKDLKKSKAEINAYAKNLKKKVEERTLALEKKKIEAEKISDFAVHRELKMIELKKTIQALKKELKDKQ